MVGFFLSIPHSKGLSTIEEALGRRLDPVVATDTLVELTSQVLDENYFEYNNRIYRQKLGTAIGMKFAPAYANLFMVRLEERLLETLVDKPLVLMRFIDNVFYKGGLGGETEEFH